MKATIQIIRKLRDSATIRGNRNFGGFFADRLARGFSQPTLIDAVESIAQSLDCSVEYVGGAALAAFISEASGESGAAIMAWCREHPKLVAMLAGMRDDADLEDALALIELPAVQHDDQSVMGDAPRYDVPLTVECQTGLAHGADTKAGNATLYRRRAVITATGRMMYLPVYAGNALRGQLRDLLADHLLQTLGLTTCRRRPALALWAFHALYAGGVLEPGKAGKVEDALGKHGAVRAEGIREIREMLPMLSLLGSAVGNRIICGRVYVGDLRPLCVEWGGGPRRANELMAWEFLTRRDDYEGRVEEDGTSAMIAETEILRPGTVMAGGIDIDSHASEIERACLARGLALLAERGRLGAENRRGLGKVRVEIGCSLDPAPYDSYLEARRDDILAYMDRLGMRVQGPELV